MKRRWRKVTQAEAGQLIALAAVILGGSIYLYQPALAGFPMNDGGLFDLMIRAVQQNHYSLPQFVQYNGLNIPFVYPPLGFYVGAAISSVLSIDPVRVLQWLPAIVLVGVSISFYRLALRVLAAPIEAGIATFLYVCTPRSATWLIMGGGLTRAFGHLFLLLAVGSVYSLYTERNRKHLAWSVVFSSLAVLSHPEAAVQTAAVCVLLFMIKGRNRRAFFDSAVVAAGTVLLGAIWWLPMVLRFGLEPFTSAAQTGSQSPLLVIYPLLLSFTEEPMMTLIAVLGLIGLAICLARREYFLPAWVLLPYVVDPRGAQTVSIVPLALMGAVALNALILPGLARAQTGNATASSADYLDSGAVRILGGYVAGFLIIMALYAGTERAQIKLSVADRTAFAWIAANTPSDSRFVIMTGEDELFCDPAQEWFPVLANRVSETTIQGQEWISDGGFFARTDGLRAVQGCLEAGSPADCLGKAATSLNLQYDYVYVARASLGRNMCWPTTSERRGAALIADLQTLGKYKSVYSAPDVEILARMQ